MLLFLLLNNKVTEAEDASTGYDALNDKFVNMIEAGIIDPTKVGKVPQPGNRPSVNVSDSDHPCSEPRSNDLTPN